MGDRKQALQDLLAKVEAGELNVNNRHWLVVLPFAQWDAAWSAYSGSLDAAESLHDAVLPGWDWILGIGGATVINPNVDEDDDGSSFHGQGNYSPARAWLIAILEALISEASNG